MKDYSRRNRNIGTAKQGYGQNNKMCIPKVWYKDDMRYYLERLSVYEKEKHIVNEHEFIFIIEETLQDYRHACSVEDVVHLLQYLPKEDYGDLKYIVFRQPKRKEAKLESVWGRLSYSFEFEKEDHPAIILEDFPIEGKLTWSKKLSINGRLEFQRLENDGFVFIETKKSYQTIMSKENVRNTQLFRTVFHEFGHYVHYLNIVERSAVEDEDVDEWIKRFDFYCKNIPSSEKETFAHNYADKLQEKLRKENLIPF